MAERSNVVDNEPLVEVKGWTGGEAQGPPPGTGLTDDMAMLPWMKLWTQKFFGSVRVQALRGEHRLIYLGLLVAEWGLDGKGLPNDIGELSRVLGISEEDMKEAWGDGQSRVSQFFELRKGRLFNETCEDEWRKALREFQGKQKGGRMRWRKEHSSSSANSSAQALHEQLASGAGDGSSSSEDQETQDSEIDIGGGGPGGELAEVLEAYAFEFHLGAPRAGGAVQRLQPSMVDVTAWRAVRVSMPVRRFLWAIQQFKNPSDLAAHEKRANEEAANDLTRIPDPDERKDKILRKRQAELKAQEKAAAEAAVPAPPEFFDAVKRIGRKPK